MMQYNIEVFDRKLNFIDFSEVIDFTISFDYLSQEKSTIIIKNTDSKYNIGNFIKLIKIGNKKPVFHGIITGIENNGTAITLEIKNILSLLEVMVEFDRNDLKIIKLEDFISNIILNTYTNSQDILQQIPIEVKINSIGIFNSTLNLKDNIHNLYEIILKAFEKYSLIVHGEITDNKIVFYINQCSDENITIDLSLPIILDKYMKFQSDSCRTNKITLINKENEQEKRTFYLLNDNTITEKISSNKRIEPVIFSYEYIQNEYNEQVEEIAKDRLLSSEFNDLIEILIIKENRIIDINSLKIGQKVTLINNKNQINSILTGYQTYKNNTIKLIFGKLRIDLTKILKQERG